MAVKVVEDSMKNAGPVLSETKELLDTLVQGWPWVQPTNSPSAVQAGGPAKYIVASRTGLSKMQLAGFDRNYPSLSSSVSNGSTGDDSNPRLIDGIFKIGKLSMMLEETKGMLKTDAQRDQARQLLKVAIGDFGIFLLAQYRLGRTDDAEFLSVSEYCSRQGISSSILYGELLDILDMVDEHPYGYEEISDCYDEMMGIDPTFLSECQESQFPLTSDICRKIISGEMPIEIARGMLLEFQKETEEVEVKGLNTSNMVQRLHLA